MNEQPKSPPEPTTHFGFRDVPVGDKQKLVGQVFTSVARNYIHFEPQSSGRCLRRKPGRNDKEQFPG